MGVKMKMVKKRWGCDGGGEMVVASAVVVTWRWWLK
jgi:hypothetical protein